MPTYTQNYNLPKPGGSEVQDVAVIGEAMDKIDTELKKNADNIGLSQFLFKFRGSFAGLNADTVAVGGWWLANGVSDPASQGLPSGFNHCILINFNTDAWLAAQIVINLATGAMKKRQRPAASYSSWVDV